MTSATLKVEGYEAITVTLEPETTPEPPNPTPGPDEGTLSVEIDYQGTIYSFHENQGTDLGDYHEGGGHFTQHCVLATHDDLPGFRVLFRRDRDSDRLEVVFELGALFSGTPQNMGSYTATILRGETLIAHINVPEHYWNSRWRWQSAPRPVIYKPELYRGSMLPAYSEALFGSAIPLSVPRTYDAPMSLAGLTAYVPSTGERDEIGLCTEAQAEFLCQSTDVAWQSVLAQLEASGTFPWHFRDEQTGAPLDWSAYPNATMYGVSGGDPQIENPTSPITLDPSHEPALAYLPFLLTGDPYALEEMQFAAVYDVVNLSPGARANFSLGNAVRAVAWTLRGLARVATVTPDTVPSWLLPRALFKARLDEQREWFMSKYVSSDTPPFSNLNLVSDAKGAPVAPPIPADCYVSVWMEDFLTTTLAHVVLMGHEEWRPVLEWKSLDVMSRTNGTSGWVRAVPSIYTMVIKDAAAGPYAEHWGVVWDLNEKYQPDRTAHDDPDTLPPALDLTYPSYALGALALASQACVPQAQASYDWLLEQMQARVPGSNRRKWAMAAGVGAAPPATGIQAKRIASLIERFGTNTFSSMDEHNAWGSWPADYRPESVIDALRYILGDSGFAFRLREYHYKGREASQRPWLQQITTALPGTQVSLCVGANGSPNDVPSMLDLAGDPSCCVAWCEGLNEPNTDFGSGEVPIETTSAIQAALAADARNVILGPSVVAGTPHPEGWITGYCGDALATLNSQMAEGNGHYYPPHCPAIPGTGYSLGEYVEGLAGAYGHPIALTEFHPTLYAATRTDHDEQRDAFYTLLTLLQGEQVGVTGLWWYALFDYGSTYRCGLFPQGHANDPRPVADALRALCAICADRGDRHGFAPGKLDVVVADLPEAGGWDVYQASDGRFLLPIWYAAEDAGEGQPVAVKVSFAAPATVEAYDPLRGETPGKKLGHVREVTLDLVPGVVVLDVRP